jgi:hypothetical protein
MRRGFIISSGTAIKDRRDKVNSAAEAFKLALLHMRFRRPNVTIADELGSPVSFFQLKDMAALEKRKENTNRD